MLVGPVYVRVVPLHIPTQLLPGPPNRSQPPGAGLEQLGSRLLLRPCRGVAFHGRSESIGWRV